MDMRAAFEDTIRLAEDRGMQADGGELSLSHLRDMQARITPGFSEGKIGRWLGWAQAAVVASGVASLEDMKALNMAHADAEPGARPTTP